MVSHAKIYENFAKYFFKTKANKQVLYIAKMYMWKATGKHKWDGAVKSKPKALWHFKVNLVLKINETFYKQTESMLWLW